MRTGLPAALLRGTPSAIRDDRFTRCPFPAATTHAPVALARSSNTAMEHRNRCTDLRHPKLLATSLLKCPRQDCCETPSETKKIGKLSPLSSFIFLTLRVVLLFQGQEILQVDEQIGGSAAVHSQSQAAVLGPNIQIPRERLGLVQDGLRRAYA